MRPARNDFSESESEPDLQELKAPRVSDQAVDSRILDPEILPIESTGADLPPVRGEVLTPAGLRARFKQTLDWAPDARDDRIKALGGDPRVASVLIALILRETGLSLLLTQRADHLSNHAGQISFPGGRREPEDIDAAATSFAKHKRKWAWMRSMWKCWVSCRTI